MLTAYYMGREYLLVFRGEQRWVEARPEGGAGAGAGAGAGYDPHDPRWVMSVPLVVLGTLSALGGLINLPFHPYLDFLDRWLDPVVRLAPVAAPLEHRQVCGASRSSTACSRCSASGWRSPCGGHTAERPALEPTVLRRAWYIDWAYDRFIARPSTEVAVETSSVVEAKVIDGAVNGVAVLVRDSGRQLRKVQTGYVRNYALGLVAGLVLILAYVLTRAT